MPFSKEAELVPWRCYKLKQVTVSNQASRVDFLTLVFPSLASVPRSNVRTPWSNLNAGHIKRSNFTAGG